MKESEYMREWASICQAYCDAVGAELLFVNSDSFGCEMPNGALVHIHADELQGRIAALKKGSVNELIASAEERSKGAGASASGKEENEMTNV